MSSKSIQEKEKPGIKPGERPFLRGVSNYVFIKNKTNHYISMHEMTIFLKIKLYKDDLQ